MIYEYRKMKTAYLSSAYLAPVEYYTKLVTYDKIYIEQHDHYMKQTYRNRCTIAGPGREIALSIPIIKPENLKCPMKDIRISDHGNWRHMHWNAIESAYNSTPFFEYYRDDFYPFYEKKYVFLADFNEELCHLICQLATFNRTSHERQNTKRTLLRMNTISGKPFIPREISGRQIRNSSPAPIIRYSSIEMVSAQI